MPVRARLFGPDREEIHDLHSWFRHAPPEKGEAQWRDGYSAKEQAKAWLRSGSPEVPDELWSALAPLVSEKSMARQSARSITSRPNSARDGDRRNWPAALAANGAALDAFGATGSDL